MLSRDKYPFFWLKSTPSIICRNVPIENLFQPSIPAKRKDSRQDDKPCQPVSLLSPCLSRNLSPKRSEKQTARNISAITVFMQKHACSQPYRIARLLSPIPPADRLDTRAMYPLLAVSYSQWLPAIFPCFPSDLLIFSSFTSSKIIPSCPPRANLQTCPRIAVSTTTIVPLPHHHHQPPANHASMHLPDPQVQTLSIHCVSRLVIAQRLLLHISRLRVHRGTCLQRTPSWMGSLAQLLPLLSVLAYNEG